MERLDGVENVARKKSALNSSCQVSRAPFTSPREPSLFCCHQTLLITTGSVFPTYFNTFISPCESERERQRSSVAVWRAPNSACGESHADKRREQREGSRQQMKGVTCQASDVSSPRQKRGEHPLPANGEPSAAQPTRAIWLCQGGVSPSPPPPQYSSFPTASVTDPRERKSLLPGYLTRVAAAARKPELNELCLSAGAAAAAATAAMGKAPATISTARSLSHLLTWRV